MRYGKRNAILTVLAAILLAAIIAAFLIPRFHALLSNDDFANSLSVRTMREQDKDSFELALTLTWNSILQLGGGLYCFIHFFFTPFVYLCIPRLRITILLDNIFFLLPVLVLVRCVAVTVLGDRKSLHLIVFYTIAVMSLIGFQYSAQLFSWMPCSLGYLLPSSGMLAGVAVYIRGIWEGKQRDRILSGCSPCALASFITPD